MGTDSVKAGIPFAKAVMKRAFDVFFSLLGILLLWWLILLAAFISRLDTGLNGFFLQQRIGRFGRPFRVIKIRTMKPVEGVATSVTTSADERITPIGRFFRKSKIDELPQLINVMIGDMSLVGPRPDVPGFADRLVGDNQLILQVRPGITGPATLQYKNEEEILAQVDDPEKYNREVIFPDKVRINLEYIRNYSLLKDIKYIAKSIVG